MGVYRHISANAGKPLNYLHFVLPVVLIALISSGERGTNAPTGVSGSVELTNCAADEYDENGVASWYGKKFHGRPTASGTPFDMNKLTAAHPSLPFETEVKVTNLENRKSVVVTINDRGPWIDDRLIDLSRAAAGKLDMITDGTARVRICVVEPQAKNVIPRRAE